MNPDVYTAIRERAAYIDLTGRGKIRVSGEDRARLLHAMCTNHVQELQPGTGCYAFFLTAQGRIIADVNIYCMPDYLLLDTEAETKDRVLEHLEKFIIADDVALNDFTEMTATVAVEGPEAEKCVAALGAAPGHIPYSFIECGPMCHLAHWTYTGGPGYTWFLPVEDKPALLEKLASHGAVQADMASADAVRLENGRPRYGIEFSDANIPQETQLMHAVHFSKGCYLGQEIVERVRSRGHVNRVLTGIRLEGGPAPEKGTKVLSGDKEAGEILSAAALPGGKIAGLAILRAEALGGTLMTSAGAVVTPVRQS
jgi:folate-binding protein YgfZ